MAGIALSRWAGTLVDKHLKLVLVRGCILVQKLSAIVAYASFLGLFSISPQPPRLNDFNSAIYYSLVVLGGCCLRISTICIQIAVEKDWVIAIASGTESHLSQLNVSLRRVDLFSNLVSPLLVSVLTTLFSYRMTVLFMMVSFSLSMLFEIYWVHTVYNQFPQLAREDDRKIQRDQIVAPRQSLAASISRQVQDWSEFIHLPVFLSSLAVSLLYITVLSYV